MIAFFLFASMNVSILHIYFLLVPEDVVVQICSCIVCVMHPWHWVPTAVTEFWETHAISAPLT